MTRKFQRRFTDDDLQGRYLVELATSADIDRATLSPMYLLNPQGVFLRGKPLSRNSSSTYSKPNPRCVSYFSTKFVVLLVKCLGRFNCTYFFCVTLSLVSRRSHAKRFVSTYYPHVTYLSIQNTVDPSQ